MVETLLLTQASLDIDWRARGVYHAGRSPYNAGPSQTAAFNRAAINTAISDALGAGAGLVLLDPGIHLVDGPIVCIGSVSGHNVMLSGAVPPGAFDFTTEFHQGMGVTRLKFDAAAAADNLVEMTPTEGADKPRLYGGGVMNLVLDGSKKATRCLLTKSILGGVFRNLAIIDATTSLMEFDVSTTLQVSTSSQENELANISMFAVEGASDGCHGLVLKGDAGGNFSHNRLSNITALTHDGDPLRVESADSTTFVGTRWRIEGGGTGRPRLMGSDVVGVVPARFNLFVNIATPGARLLCETGTQTNSENTIHNLMRSNSNPDPEVQDGATLDWLRPGDGRALVRLSANEVISDVTPTEIDWDVAVDDLLGKDGSWWEGVTNPERLTVPALYGIQRVRITANIRWDSGSTGTRFVSILKNGSPIYGLPSVRCPAETDPSRQNLVSAVVGVVDGDYFTVEVAHSQTTDLDVVNSNESWFSIEAV